jgi:hypothetical protein
MCFKKLVTTGNAAITLSFIIDGYEVKSKPILVSASNNFDTLVPTHLLFNGGSASNAVLGVPFGANFSWNTINALCDPFIAKPLTNA